MRDKPFLTLITRTCRRPRMLSKALDSVIGQTSRDVEVIFIIDPKKRGVRWANKQFGLHTSRVDGDYVYTLDDDTFLPNKNFVKRLKQLINKLGRKPAVIMVKGRRPQLAPNILPKQSVWGKRRALRVGSTNGACFIVRADAWKKHAHNYGKRGSGDWNFLSALKSDGTLDFFWWGFIAKETQQLGRGRKFESCPRNWWRPIAKKYGIERLKKFDWRLRLWQR